MRRITTPWLLLCLLVAACTTADGSGSNETSPPVQPRDEAKKAQAPAALSAALERGQCASQADCPSEQVCVSVMPGEAVCTPRSAMPSTMPLPARAAKNGRPAPPVGLLDGQVLRQHVISGGP
jgi:hypothetical protein